MKKLTLLLAGFVLFSMPHAANAAEQCTTGTLDLVCEDGEFLQGITNSGQKICKTVETGQRDVSFQKVTLSSDKIGDATPIQAYQGPDDQLVDINGESFDAEYVYHYRAFSPNNPIPNQPDNFVCTKMPLSASTCFISGASRDVAFNEGQRSSAPMSNCHVFSSSTPGLGQYPLCAKGIPSVSVSNSGKSGWSTPHDVECEFTCF